jgi:hypothetical protein
MTAKPRPQDDKAIAEICQWLIENKLVALVKRSGQVVIMPKEDVYPTGGL